jgi:CPA2 family monovalent cation:H+ antiporter-2
MHEYVIIKDIVGFLVAGMMIRPYGFTLMSIVDNISTMTEVGVILLLFTLGLDVSIVGNSFFTIKMLSL